jgi:RNA polymerase sigma factor for flagellar operon FliA
MLSCHLDERPTILPRGKSRDELILENMPQVRLIAKRILKGLPHSVTLDDLISAGVMGLIAAIDRYDENHEVKLKTYAEYKIRGAILDSLRTLDWAPRRQRKRRKLIEAAVAVLEQKHGRIPREEEIADQLGIAIEELQDWQADTQGMIVGSLESSKSEDDERDLTCFLSDSQEQWPSQLFERAELGRLLDAAIQRIPRLERIIVTLYFYEGMTLRDIARMVDLHESRISQLKAQATARLRSYLRQSWPQGRKHSGNYSPRLMLKERGL